MKYILSYGGGVNSSALYFHILNKRLPLDLVIFADTGEELPETYDAVERMKNICKKDGIEFVTCQSHHGDLYNYYFSKRAVMSFMRRDCTSKFKISPIRKYIRNEYGKKETFTMYIGIAWDEATRIRNSDVKYITNSFPFVDDKITRIGNIKILRENGFKAKKSGCKGCIYNKKTEWLKMLIEQPKEFDRHMKLEENNSAFPRVMLNGRYTLRSFKEKHLNQQSLNSFEDNESTCDVINGGCFL